MKIVNAFEKARQMKAKQNGAKGPVKFGPMW